jgi:hypothetical protein
MGYLFVSFCPLTVIDMCLAWPAVQVRWANRHGLSAAEKLSALWMEQDRNDYALMRRAQTGVWPEVAAVRMCCSGIVPVRGEPSASRGGEDS